MEISKELLKLLFNVALLNENVINKIISTLDQQTWALL